MEKTLWGSVQEFWFVHSKIASTNFISSLPCLQPHAVGPRWRREGVFMQHSPWQSFGQHAPTPSRPLSKVSLRPKGKMPSQPYLLICWLKSKSKLVYHGESPKPWKARTNGTPKECLGAYSCGTTNKNCLWISGSCMRWFPGGCGEHGTPSCKSWTCKAVATTTWSADSHMRFWGCCVDYESDCSVAELEPIVMCGDQCGLRLRYWCWLGDYSFIAGTSTIDTSQLLKHCVQWQSPSTPPPRICFSRSKTSWHSFCYLSALGESWLTKQTISEVCQDGADLTIALESYR